jgi:hypothetical protein
MIWTLSILGMKNKKHKISYSNENKFVWFHTPKCGTRSIIEFLKKNTKLKVNEASTVGVEHYIEIENFSSYFKFAFVRNPWSRLVSCWHSKVEKCRNPKGPNRDHYYKQFGSILGYTFPEFVRYLDQESNVFRDPHWHPLYSYLPVKELDFVGKTENLKEDLYTVCDKIGIPRQELPHENKSDRTHYTEYYDDETKQIVAEKYAKDIEYFGYEY